MKRFVKLTDEYIAKLKHLAKRKIRATNRMEVWTLWDAKERCFFTPNEDSGWYVDDPYQRPTHIQIG